MVCPYADIAGVPGEGVHRFRIFGLAAVDLGGTALLAVIAGRLLPGPMLLSTVLAFIILMVIAFIAHDLAGVNTRLVSAVRGATWPGPHPCC